MENGQKPATKADLNALRDELREAISESERTLRDELIEVISDTETKLLRAFYNFAESNQKRLSEVERTDLGILERLATIERRVTEVEKRLNTPPTS